ncbi:hypothetical protein [Glaciecola sp. KUL10]|uniref:phage tail assembly protein T n=1 Tax=Glaciecola sp. (strain KUL10) TaxID=2161813 RepID=UPI000D78912D|nr:hypothetical protein [Glaciecola sp. KUL10]GBL02930.1 hypothetical protein KUL10_02030 [Glaciecola sp. KUL10]
MAVKLGNHNVDHMLSDLLASDFVEFQRFYALEPFGSKFEELHLAALRCQLTNYLRSKEQPAYSFNDFLLSAVEKVETRKQSITEAYRILSSLK